MRVQFLGTAGYHPNERRHTSGVFLPECGVVLDAGTGSFRIDPRLQTDQLQIFVSHAHLDHIIGLTYLIVPVIQKRLRQIQVYSAPEYLEAIREHLYAEPLFPVAPNFALVPVEPTVAVPLGGRLTWRKLDHPGGSLAFRIDWPDRSLAYVTDTTCDGSYVEFVRGVSLLIHECNFGDTHADFARKTGHSCTTPVAQLAREAGVGQLWLTHIDPEFTEDDPVGIETARAIFPATHYAADLLEVEF